MKKFLCGFLAVMMLSIGANAAEYDPSAPKSPPPAHYTESLKQYEVNQAIQLGFVPDEVKDDIQNPITRGEFAETALRFAAMQYHYDLQNFLEVCKLYPPKNGEGERTVYQQGVIADVKDSDSITIDWAYALGLISGKEADRFDPTGAITRQEAAVILKNIAAFYGAVFDPGGNTAKALTCSDADKISSWAKESVLLMQNWGVMTGDDSGCFNPASSLTKAQCLATFARLYYHAPKSREKGNIKPLISYEKELQRVLNSDAFSVKEQLKLDAGTVVYRADKSGENTLVIVYQDGGSKNLPMPVDSLVYLKGGRFIGLLYVAGPDGVRYEINTETLACIPVAPPGTLFAVVGEDQGNVQSDPVDQNEFGMRAQNVPIVGNMAIPHIVHNGYMPIYTDNGNPWKLSKGDVVTIQIRAERMAEDPHGQYMTAGYILKGTKMQSEVRLLLNSTSFTYNIPEDGDYRFYVLNTSADPLYITSFTINIWKHAMMR